MHLSETAYGNRAGSQGFCTRSRAAARRPQAGSHLLGSNIVAFLPVLLLLTSGCAGPETVARKTATQMKTLEQDRNFAYYHYDQWVKKMLDLAGRFTDEEFSTQRLEKYSTKTVKQLVDAESNASFYTHGGEPHLSRYEAAFNELARRQAAPADAVEDLFQQFLAGRHLDRAQRLKDRFPTAKLWALPQIIQTADSSASLYRVYDVSADSATATIRRLPLETGPRIVMAAWYSCSAAQQALEYLSADSRLKQIMHDHGMILSGRFEPGGVALRNNEVSYTRAYIAYTELDWPGMNFASSPNFYFLKDGKILHSFAGADSKEYFTKEFSRGLQAVGLQVR